MFSTDMLYKYNCWVDYQEKSYRQSSDCLFLHYCKAGRKSSKLQDGLNLKLLSLSLYLKKSSKHLSLSHAICKSNALHQTCSQVIKYYNTNPSSACDEASMFLHRPGRGRGNPLYSTSLVLVYLLRSIKWGSNGKVKKDKPAGWSRSCLVFDKEEPSLICEVRSNPANRVRPVSSVWSPFDNWNRSLQTPH